jgi:hypothetical protein
MSEADGVASNGEHQTEERIEQERREALKYTAPAVLAVLLSAEREVPHCVSALACRPTFA